MCHIADVCVTMLMSFLILQTASPASEQSESEPAVASSFTGFSDLLRMLPIKSARASFEVRFLFLHILTFLLHILTFLLHVLTFLLHVLTFLLYILTFLLHRLTFLLHILTFLLHVLTFLLFLLLILTFLLFLLHILTFLFFLRHVLTFLLFLPHKLTFLLHKLTFLLHKLILRAFWSLAETVPSFIYGWHVANIHASCSPYNCDNLPTR
jgi:hypothetical protein